MKTPLLLSAFVLLLGACDGPDPDFRDPAYPSDAGDAGDVGDAGCVFPNEGCACDFGTTPITCYEQIGTAGEHMMCSEGERFCRDGVWSGCETIRSFIGGTTAALIMGPGMCSFGCDPACARYEDTPGPADVPGDNSSDVEYSAPMGGTAGIVIVEDGMGVGTLVDSDGDGVPDIADDFPGDPSRDGISEVGGFGHTLPFGGPGELDPLPIMVQVRTADIYFLMDTTGSMGGEIANLRTTLSTGTFLAGCPGGVIGAISCTIPDAWFGVGHHDDYTIAPYGGSVDNVYDHLLDITPSVASAQAAVNSLPLHWGYDWPESQSQALWAVATGGGLGSHLAPHSCPGDRWGYPCFRDGAIPIVILMTDAPFHNGPSGNYGYSIPGGSPSLPTRTAVAGNNDQASAHMIGDAATSWTGWEGNSCALTNNSTATCATNNSPDAVFQFTVSTTTSITMTLEGSNYDSLLSLRNAAFNQIACNDDTAGLGVNSRITRTLSPGTYYLIVEGYASGCGTYHLAVGNPVTFPVSWADSVNALNARDIRVITVYSGGSGPGRNDVNALADATGAVSSTGSRYVFPISSNGSGLGSAIVDAVVDLANYSRMDVSLRAVDNPATPAVDERNFLATVNANGWGPGSCTGIVGSTFIQCLPGTSVDYEVTFQNGFVMPTALPQVFDFFIEVVGNGSFIIERVPVRIVVPPDAPRILDHGSYWQTYAATDHCEIPPDRPDWDVLTWSGATPSDSRIELHIRTAESEAALAGATPVVFQFPASAAATGGSFDIGDFLTTNGQLNFLPYLSVTAEMYSSSDRTVSPVLIGFTLEYTCVPSE